jgi:hypothetical protein
MKGEAKITLPQAYCYQSAKRHHAVNTHRFYTSAFSTLCFVLSVMEGKIEQCVCFKFCTKLGKSITKTPEMLHEALGEHSLSWTAVLEWHSCFKAGRM